MQKKDEGMKHMNFSEKLDFLMNLTGTSNSSLGRALSYDASYISRVRAGKRGLPRRQPFTRPAADFFGRAIDNPIQQNAAASLLTPGRPWPRDPDQATALILRWLEAAPEEMNEPIGQFFQSIAGSVPEGQAAPPVEVRPVEEDPAFFLGNEGKREAVLRFLGELCSHPEARTLHLASDESMDWFAEDPVFARQWTALLSRFLTQGGEISIIHTIDRPLGEMLGALQQWMPLYLTGQIRPYYCPRLRDGIIRRSLFVAPGLAALAACSIEDRTGGMVNLYTRSPAVTAAYEEEFKSYLALCRPLMDIYQQSRSKALHTKLLAEIREDGPLFFAGPLPLPLASGVPSIRLLRSALLDRLASGGELIELLHLPDLAELHSVPLPLHDLLETSGKQYSPQILRDQMADALARMQSYPNYRVILSHSLPETVSLLARGREEVLVFPSAPPSTVFALAEPRMTSALWDFLQRAAGPSDRKRAERTLKAWLKKADRVLARKARKD